MALRNQPYIPLYVQDFLTDEKLNECSAESTGVYIRLMCLMHKSEEYGTILLKQKDKQTGKQISDFAIKLARQMPFDADTIARSLTELLDESVISLDGEVLFQKRMVRDGKLSDTRASAGSKGGRKKQNQDFASQFATGVASNFAQAKTVANTENEIESEIEYENESVGDSKKKGASPRAKKKGKSYAADEKAYKAAAYLDDCICKRLPTQKPADDKKLQTWADAFDKCNRIDGQNWDLIARVLKFSQEDPFWQGNILSGAKFREKFVQLLSKMHGTASGGRSSASNAMRDLQELHEMFREEEGE